jgi:hypothetical protein
MANKNVRTAQALNVVIRHLPVLANDPPVEWMKSGADAAREMIHAMAAAYEAGPNDGKFCYREAGLAMCEPLAQVVAMAKADPDHLSSFCIALATYLTPMLDGYSIEDMAAFDPTKNSPKTRCARTKTTRAAHPGRSWRSSAHRPARARNILACPRLGPRTEERETFTRLPGHLVKAALEGVRIWP